MARILVIDDENNIRMMLKLALAHIGHTVETAADGYEGLEKFATGSDWDLVLLDQRMPGMEGLEVLREIRRRQPDTCVLMITAFGTIDLATEAIAAGATDFLRKPFTVETLRKAVSAALRGETLVSNTSLSPIPYSFDMTTVNGFRLSSSPGVETAPDGSIRDQFTVLTVNREAVTCQVNLPPYFVELVKAHADREELPGGENFWQALCGEALANYLWQNAQLPDGNMLTVDDLTRGLCHWIDAVLSAMRKV
jgi:DNA-binding response OmpR family regulator